MLSLPSYFIQAVIFVTGIVCLLAGLAVVWTNPHRLANRVFMFSSILTTSWLSCVYAAMKSGTIIDGGGAADLIFWLRLNAAVAAFFPFTLWLMIHSLVSNECFALALR